MLPHGTASTERAKRLRSFEHVAITTLQVQNALIRSTDNEFRQHSYIVDLSIELRCACGVQAIAHAADGLDHIRIFA